MPGLDASGRWLLVGAAAVPGDGVSFYPEATLLVEGGRIAALDPGRHLPAEFGGRILFLEGCLVMPGLINGHAHGVTLGPLFASGALPLPPPQVRAQLDAHLAWGETTVLNLDGFALPEEVAEAARGHPVRLRTATCHTPLHVRAARAADGRGLTPRHRRFTAEEAAAAGAVAVGEAGSGHTLGGGGQEYLYLPEAVRQATGRLLSPAQARRLKEAVLGRDLGRARADPEELARALAEAGLEGVLSPEEAERLVRRTVLPSLRPALAAIREAARVALSLGLPLVVHTALVSRKAIARLCRDRRCGIPAGLRLIAGHANHDSFTPEEAVAFARWLKEHGAVVDASTFDAFGARCTTDSPENLWALLREGLVDTLSTDYGGGLWDPMLVAAKEAVARGFCTLPRAVAMMTSRVAEAIPGLAPGRGLLAPGEPADLVWVDARDLARVRGVMVDGKVVWPQPGPAGSGPG